MRTYLRYVALLIAATVAAAQGDPPSVPGQPNFGPNMLVFDPSMSQTDIQNAVNAVATQQVSNQFGTQRYALLFKPGTYGSSINPLIFQVGYYTEVAGLGESPADVVINGKIDVRNQCFTSGCNALDNFWRSLSNLTINAMGADGCYSANEFWAVSQAAHAAGPSQRYRHALRLLYRCEPFRQRRFYRRYSDYGRDHH